MLKYTYKDTSAEAKVLKEAARTPWISLLLSDDIIHRKIVISDALSVLQALSNPRNQDISEVATALTMLQQYTEKTVIQWIISHYNIRGNDEADRLAKEGGKLPQKNHQVTYDEELGEK